MNIVFGLFYLLFGLLIGSFLNVCIYRIPRKESIAFGRSHCTTCNEPIKAYDLIPVVSFLFLRGKCRNCGSKISARYPLIETLTGILFLLSYLFFGPTLKSLLFCAFFAVLVVLALIDFDTQEIPNRLIIAIAALAAAAVFVEPEISIWSRVIGFFIVSVPILLLVLLGGMGGGDLKLMAVSGFLLGAKLIVVAALFGVLIGGAAGAVILIRKKTGGKAKMAFGPSLAAGLVLASLFGNTIADGYLALF